MISAAFFFSAAALCLVVLVEHRHKILKQSTEDLKAPGSASSRRT